MSRPTPPYADESWGWGKEAQPVIGITCTRVALLRLALGADWQEIPPADGGRVGNAPPARARRRYWFGNDPATIGDYAWFKDNAGEQPHVGGAKKANAWGLYDIHGNVAEWTADNTTPATTRTAPGGSEGRQRQGALSLRRARRILGRCAGEIEERGAAIVDRGVEPPGSAESEELVVAHGCDLRRLPRRRRVGQFVEVRVGCQTTPECTAGTIPWSALWTSEISRHPPRRGVTSSRHPRRRGRHDGSSLVIPAHAAGTDEIKVGPHRLRRQAPAPWTMCCRPRRACASSRWATCSRIACRRACRT